jgi:hypothetical protein
MHRAVRSFGNVGENDQENELIMAAEHPLAASRAKLSSRFSMSIQSEEVARHAV